MVLKSLRKSFSLLEEVRMFVKFLKSLISPVTNTITTFNNNRTALKKADLDIKLAEKENRARLLRDENNNNHDWEMANLTDKDKWLRRMSFTMFALPFVWAFFDPSGVKEYFDVALHAMPAWYIKMFGGIVGGIWGISALKNSVPALIGGIKKSMKE